MHIIAQVDMTLSTKQTSWPYVFKCIGPKLGFQHQSTNISLLMLFHCKMRRWTVV